MKKKNWMEKTEETRKKYWIKAFGCIPKRNYSDEVRDE